MSMKRSAKQLFTRHWPLCGMVLACSASAISAGCTDAECQRDEVKVGNRCVEIGPGGRRSDGGALPEGERGSELPRASDSSVAVLVDATPTDLADDAMIQTTDASVSSCVATAEVCDQKDNDCDGVTDNGVTNACGGCDPIQAGREVGMPCDNNGEGPCGKSGTWECHAGITVCTAPDPTPSDEVCDGKDNDCDGVVDNGVMKNSCGGCKPLEHEKDDACDNGLKGECAAAGTYRCSSDGQSVACSAPAKSASPEVCDDKDNDCNGAVDDEPSDALRWYRDCDGDGYAASTSGAVSACKSPKPTGTCNGWTDREPAGKTSTDCDDENAAYKPGADYGIPSGSNTSSDLNCDGKVEVLATVTADTGELNICSYPASCDCHVPVTRNGMLLEEWDGWKNLTTLSFHPPISCSMSANDRLIMARFTSDAAKKLLPDEACAAQVTVDSAGARQVEAWVAVQRCR